MNIPISGDSAFLMSLYARYRQDRASVPADWMVYFETLDSGSMASTADPSIAGQSLLAAYRAHGHKQAKLDPLGLVPAAVAPEIAAAAARIGNARVEMPVAGQTHGLTGELTGEQAGQILRQVYCGTAALEAEHIGDAGLRAWVYDAFEREVCALPDDRVLGSALEAILLADEFERFIKTKWPTKKRFGIEGSEASAVILREVFRAAAKAGQAEVVIGGMHRGRLASLATVFGKSLPVLISEIKGKDITDGDALFTGDVPYHNGLAAQVETDAGPLDVRLLPHPSHLIVVAPVALGAARARQELRGRQDAPGGAPRGAPGQVLPLLLHTDAAFAGQGLVSELLQLGGLGGYTAGGTIHLVVNNQIGFTTLPSEGRSTPYPTDIGKAYGIPILHVNGDDPVAAASVARIAHAWQRHTGKDVIIDLVCYRRNGHNELDEPRFTQPAAWAAIDKHPTLRTLFTQAVGQQSPTAHDAAEAKRAAFAQQLAHAYETYDAHRLNDSSSETDVFPEPSPKRSPAADAATGVALDTLRALGRIITEIPADLIADPKVRAFASNRWTTIDQGAGLNMATAEALAFASLLHEGTSVRLSGQDTVRGTFTQRHLAMHDAKDGHAVIPLARAVAGTAQFDAINSPLIEYGAIAFEYGMSLADPDRLVMWEAQFGDFLNGAQIAVDQYIVTAEAKWRMRSSLVIALPHGLEGQGPDHSSARIERILQSCAGGNITVAIPSTPANLFHLLRRQQRGARRTPLFLIAPKSLLREKECRSALADFVAGTAFQPVIVSAAPGACQRMVFCAGKIFYPLNDYRQRESLQNVSLVRVEQLYPFPLAEIRALLAAHPEAELVWCQEEPRNQGAYSYVFEQIFEATGRTAIRFAGRPAMAAAAGGSIDRHELEQAAIVANALKGAC